MSNVIEANNAKNRANEAIMESIKTSLAQDYQFKKKRIISINPLVPNQPIASPVPLADSELDNTQLTHEYPHLMLGSLNGSSETSSQRFKTPSNVLQTNCMSNTTSTKDIKWNPACECIPLFLNISHPGVSFQGYLSCNNDSSTSQK